MKLFFSSPPKKRRVQKGTLSFRVSSELKRDQGLFRKSATTKSMRSGIKKTNGHGASRGFFLITIIKNESQPIKSV